jgi:NADPH-dependent 2,4-dienoyl-CoA reductase/sulfur reductase-like enzyme
MQAAIVLAKRGFKPVIFEKDSKLGGAANLAAIPPHKELMGEFVDTMIEELKALKVEVRLNSPATVEEVAKLYPVGIFLATGGNPIIPALDGIENAVTSTDVLTKAVEYKDKNIIVVGGGVTGLETAETLCADNQVTIIEMAKDVGTTLYASAKALLVKRLTDQGTKILTETTLVSVQKDSITVKDAQGESKTIPCDAVVLAMGVRSDRSLREEFEQSFDRVILIGDSEKPGQIREALHTAYDKAFVF